MKRGRNGGRGGQGGQGDTMESDIDAFFEQEEEEEEEGGMYLYWKRAFG